MVWRRRLLGAAVVAAACGGHRYDVGIDSPAGEAGAAGEAAEPASASGGTTSSTIAGPTGTGGSTVRSAAGFGAIPTAGTTAYAGTGGASTSQPVAGTGGAAPPDAGAPTGNTTGGTDDGSVTGSGGADDDASAAGGTNDDPVTGTGGTANIDPPPSSGGAYTGNGRPAECHLLSLTTQADLSPTDQCIAVYTCSGKELEVSCDGENDGTNTSLCDCRSGELRWYAPGLIQGEAPGSCNSGMVACFGAWPSGG